MLAQTHYLVQEFNNCASSYDQVAFLSQTVATRLIERLNLFPYLKPKAFLDVGCGTGDCLARLQKQYSNSHAVGLDISWHALRQAKRKTRRWFRKSATLIVGDIMHSELAHDQFDVICANLSLLWIDDLHKLFTILFQLLKKGGLLLFTGLGQDTFAEYLQAPTVKRSDAYPWGLCDIHTFGNTLSQAYFQDIVLDTDYFNLIYNDSDQFFTELRQQGLHTLLSVDNNHFTKKRTISYQAPFNSTYEIIYGQAWKLSSPQSVKNTYTKPVDSISIFRSNLLKD